MHEFSFFLLKNWLPVGLASILFFLIGLLVAKFIWGRYAQRLAFAVEENLNLASQWSALGSSQRDLFKKLRARWQEDRDAWEGRLSETEDLLEEKEARIAQLTSRLEGSGKAVPEEVVPDASLKQEIRELKSRLRERDEAIARLEREIESAETRPEPGLAQLVNGGSLEEEGDLPGRIRDLEQDLIDTHDELHGVRADYLKQVELVESLEEKLIEASDTAAEDEARRRIAELEGENVRAAAATDQYSAILARRSEELLSLRELLRETRRDNERLAAEVEEARDNRELEERIESLEAQLEEKEKDFERELGKKERELDGVRESLESARAEAERKTEDIEELRAEIAVLEEKVAAAAQVERRRSQLQAELNDAYHEMYDVRSALNWRLDEIALLEGRLDELGGIPGYRARIRPIVSRITIHWPSFYNVVTGKTLALPNLIALQHIPLSPAGVIAKRPAPIALPNSCAAEWRMAPDAVFSPYASVRYFTPHMVHSQYNLL